MKPIRFLQIHFNRQMLSNVQTLSKQRL